MEIVVGVWSRRTHDPAYNNQSVHQKVTLITNALNNLQAEIGVQGIPAAQNVQGIFVAPEYLFASHNHGREMAGGGFHGRSLSEHKKNSIITILRGISAQFPRILIVPGTIAWKKVFDAAAGDRYHAAGDVQQQMVHVVPGLNLAGPAVAQRGFGYKLHTAGRNKITQFLIREPRYRDALKQIVCNVLNVHLMHMTFNRLLNELPTFTDLFENIAGPTRANLIANQDYYRSRNFAQKLAAIQDPTCTYMMRNTSYVFLDGDAVYEYNKQGDFYEAVGARHDTVYVPGGDPGEYEIDGINFGFEICLDHDIGYARAQSTGVKDIHILCSAMVANIADNRSVALGGHAIHACSNDAFSGVWTKTAMGHTYTPVPTVGAAVTFGADPFQKYLIDCEVDEMAGLPSLFG